MQFDEWIPVKKERRETTSDQQIIFFSFFKLTLKILPRSSLLVQNLSRLHEGRKEIRGLVARTVNMAPSSTGSYPQNDSIKILLPLTHQMAKDDRGLYSYYRRAIFTKLISCWTTALPMSSKISGSLGLNRTLILPTQGKNLTWGQWYCSSDG